MAREQKWTCCDPHAKDKEERALAAERDKIVRNKSVANDIFLDLPVSVQMPDGESHYLKPSPSLLPYDTRSEILRSCVKPPPNKTICCTPDWQNSTHSVPCSCGPPVVNPHATKSSLAGQHSGWSLSWSRSSKTPPCHSRPRNPQTQRTSISANQSSTPRSANSNHKPQNNTSGPTSTVFAFLLGSGAADKPNSSARLKVPCSAQGVEVSSKAPAPVNEKVHHCSSGLLSNSRTSPNNNNNSSGVLARFVEEPLSFSSTSNDRKRNGKSSKSCSHAGSVVARVEENTMPGSVVSSTGCVPNMIANERAFTRVNEAFKGPFNSSQNSDKICLPVSSTLSKEGIEEDEILGDKKARRNDNNGNARVSVTPFTVDKKEEEGKSRNLDYVMSVSSEFGNSLPNVGGSCGYSNLSSTTDSSLYHLNMYPASALSESIINETAHSELSENFTSNQLSDQYCSAEIASTSSICSAGQNKDVRSLRDVT